MDFLTTELERMATNIATYTGSETEIPIDDISGQSAQQQAPATRQVRPRPARKENVSYLMKLSGPLSTAAQIRAAANLTTTPAIMPGTTDEGEQAQFCRLTPHARDTINAWLADRAVPPGEQPTFVRLCLSAKELSPHSPYPTLSLDTTLPQHRPSTTTDVFRPLQDEYPVWYFFYGTLADEEKLVDLLGLGEDEYPVLEPATVEGGTVKTWGGKYKVLVDGAETVAGWAYCVRTREHEDILRTYESERYEVVRCRMRVEGREGDVLGCVFRCADVDAVVR